MTRESPDVRTYARPSEDVFDSMRDFAASVFALGSHSVHGPDHWHRVETVGLALCKETGADEAVIRLFAILHDSCRLDDGADPLHGPRAADMLGEIAGSLRMLDPDRLALLEYAIRHHTGGRTSDDPTIGACWDADRLDLGRVGIVPHERFVSTESGHRRIQLIRAEHLSTRNHDHRHR